MKKKLISVIAIFMFAGMVCAAAGNGMETMTKVFRSIVKNEFDHAWAQRQKLTQATSPEIQVLLDLSDALQLARPEGTGKKVSLPCDPWQAMTLVRNIYVRGEGLEAANEFLASDGIELSTDVIEKIVENRLIEATFAHDNEHEYRRLLTVIDETNPSYGKARAKLAEIDFKNRCTSAQGCRNYMRDYPESPLVEKAKALTLQYDYEDAEKEGTVQSWKKFIDSYRSRPEAQTLVAQAQRNLETVQNAQLVNSNVTLAELDRYAASTRREIENHVFMVYDNLINLPTHSYRFMSLKLNFGGATGRVVEQVKQVKGKSFTNRFVFNSQGLLTEHYDGYLNKKVEYSYDFDPQHGFYPVSKTEGGKRYSYSCSYDRATGRLSMLKCSDGTVVMYTFDERGRIEERKQTDADGKTVTSTYKSGKVRTETGPKQTMKFLKYDDNRATQIDIEKGKVTDKWTYVYTQGENGAWVKAVASLNGKEQFTITREITPAE